MERALKYTFIALVAIVVVAIGFVYGLYFYGARNIPEAWKPATTTYPGTAREALWRSLGGKGDPVAESISPLGYVWRVGHAIATEKFEFSPSLMLASRTSRLAAFMGSGSQGSRHLMEASATIQASRWPVEQQLDTVLDHAYFAEGVRGFRQGAMHVFGQPLEQLDAAQLHVLLTLDWFPSAVCDPNRLRKMAVARAEHWDARIPTQELERALATVDRRCVGNNKQRALPSAVAPANAGGYPTR